MRRALIPAFLLAFAAALGLGSGSVVAASGRTTLRGSIPVWATPQDFSGAVSGSGRVGFRVYLGWSNPAAVVGLAQAVSDPASSSYRQYLSPSQFRQQFSPSLANASQIVTWLHSKGFTIDYIPANRHYVEAEGTVQQASSAFATSFAMYRVGGLTLRSPSTELSLPSRFAGIVEAVVGLDDSFQLAHPDATTGQHATSPTVTGTPCSSYYGERISSFQYDGHSLDYAPCGYTPRQVNNAYGLAPLAPDGSGQTVAILDAYPAPTVVQDTTQWSTNHGVPQLRAAQLTQVVAPGAFQAVGESQQDVSRGEWNADATLAVEAVHGTAPGANIVFVSSANGFQDLDAALNTLVDQRMASIVDNPFSFPTALLPHAVIGPYEETILQGVVEGMGIYAASGNDSDGSLTGALTPDWPAASPFVTAVGGTGLAVGAADARLFEAGWGTGTSSWDGIQWVPASPVWAYGSGGGVTTLFAEPGYQQNIVPQIIATAQGQPNRVVPDISAVADPNTGYLLGQTQAFPEGNHYSEYRIGGTSLASALVAATMALADQAAGVPHGFANPLLYQNNSAFQDVVQDPTGSASDERLVRVDFANGINQSGGLDYVLCDPNHTLSLSTRPGYDDVTGMGTPTAALVNLP